MAPLAPIPLLAVLGQEVDVDSLRDAVDAGGLDASDWITAGVVLGVAVVGSAVAARAVAGLLRRRGIEGFAGDLVGRLLGYLVFAIGLFYSLSVLGVRVGPLLGALGIAGVALAFALKDILENFLAGVLLQVRRPFDKGDQIATGDHEGTVREVNARSVVIEQPSGERVVVPSAALIHDPIVNLTAHPVRRTTLAVGVGYDTDLDEARSVILGALAGLDDVVDDPAPQALVEQFGESSIDLAVRYWHRSTIGDMWATRDVAARAIKAALDGAGIEIPFPQRVLAWAPGSAPPRSSDRPPG
ncbi:MAG: mechanosensitive ion channel family protein [Acidimicrobiales bacterium]